jgi:hypothetical protein
MKLYFLITFRFCFEQKSQLRSKQPSSAHNKPTGRVGVGVSNRVEVMVRCSCCIRVCHELCCVRGITRLTLQCQLLLLGLIDKVENRGDIGLTTHLLSRYLLGCQWRSPTPFK